MVHFYQNPKSKLPTTRDLDEWLHTKSRTKEEERIAKFEEFLNLNLIFEETENLSVEPGKSLISSEKCLYLVISKIYLLSENLILSLL